MIKEMLQSAIDAGKKKKQKSQPKEKTPPAKPEPLQDKVISELQMKQMKELPLQPDDLSRTESLEKGSYERSYEKLPESKPTELIRRSRLGERIAEIRLGKAGKKRILAELEKQKEDYNKKNNRP